MRGKDVPSATKMFFDNQLFDEVEPALSVLQNALGVDQQKAAEGLRALAKAGYVIAPRNPSNAMLMAYLESYGQTPSQAYSTITAIAKAKKRWQAMADTGMRQCFSTRRIEEPVT